MCFAPPELSASIQFSPACQWHGMMRNIDHWENMISKMKFLNETSVRLPPSNSIFKRVGMVKQAWLQLLMKVKFFSPYEYKCHIYSKGLTNLRLGASWQPAWQDMSMMHVSIDVAWVGLRLWQKDGSVPISRFLSFTPWTKWSFILLNLVGLPDQI